MDGGGSERGGLEGGNRKLPTGRQVLSRAILKHCETMDYGLPQLGKAFSLPFWSAGYSNNTKIFGAPALRRNIGDHEEQWGRQQSVHLGQFSQLNIARQLRDYPISREKSSSGTERRFLTLYACFA